LCDSGKKIGLNFKIHSGDGVEGGDSCKNNNEQHAEEHEEEQLEKGVTTRWWCLTHGNMSFCKHHQQLLQGLAAQ
jgi:hypothetical protein